MTIYRKLPITPPPQPPPPNISRPVKISSPNLRRKEPSDDHKLHTKICSHESLIKIVHRSISGESLTGNVHILNHFPQERDSDLLVAFYVKLQSSQGDTYIMNQEALLRALKESVAAFSSLIRKQVYNIRAYHEDEQRPPPRESRIDESQTKWIIIGVCAAVSVVMVMVIVVLCR